MDIYAKPGTKVRFLNRNGYDRDLEYANEVLNTEDVYEVERVDIGGWSSSVYLVGQKRPFNTVMFDIVGDYESYDTEGGFHGGKYCRKIYNEEDMQ